MNSGIALVTGAPGFLGRHIVAPLAGCGYDVHGCSRSGAMMPGMVRSHRTDVLNSSAIESLIATVRPSALIMAAWTTKHGTYWSDPENDQWARASEDLAQVFCRQGGARIVFVGTCAEYDWSDPVLSNGPISEQAARGAPLSRYGRAKRRAAESVARVASHHGARFAEARLFFPIGPGENRDRFVPMIVNAILSERPAKLGPSNQIRDLIDVRDAGAAIAKLTASDVAGAVNVGTGVPRHLGDVARRVGELMGRPHLIEIGALEPRANDPPMLVADTCRLSLDLDFRGSHTLDEALLASIAFWKAQRDGADREQPALTAR